MNDVLIQWDIVNGVRVLVASKRNFKVQFKLQNFAFLSDRFSGQDKSLYFVVQSLYCAMYYANSSALDF